MAFIIYHEPHNGKKAETLSHEKALQIWRVLNNEVEPANELQAEFMTNVKHLYLNRHNAPQSYIEGRRAHLGGSPGTHSTTDFAGQLGRRK